MKLNSAVPASIVGEILDNPDDAAALSLAKLAADMVLDWVIEKSVRDYAGMQRLGITTLEGKAQLAFSLGRIDREMFRWVKALGMVARLSDCTEVEEISLSCNYVEVSNCSFHSRVDRATQFRAALAMAVWTINEFSAMDIREDVEYG